MGVSVLRVPLCCGFKVQRGPTRKPKSMFGSNYPPYLKGGWWWGSDDLIYLVFPKGKWNHTCNSRNHPPPPTFHLGAGDVQLLKHKATNQTNTYIQFSGPAAKTKRHTHTHASTITRETPAPIRIGWRSPSWTSRFGRCGECPPPPGAPEASLRHSPPSDVTGDPVAELRSTWVA